MSPQWQHSKLKLDKLLSSFGIWWSVGLLAAIWADGDYLEAHSSAALFALDLSSDWGFCCLLLRRWNNYDWESRWRRDPQLGKSKSHMTPWIFRKCSELVSRVSRNTLRLFWTQRIQHADNCTFATSLCRCSPTRRESFRGSNQQAWQSSWPWKAKSIKKQIQSIIANRVYL